MGVDMINVGREPMLAIGCIQAQKCHTGHCPTGVATQSRWLMRGLDPTDKAARAANYVISLRHGLRQLANACGQAHPAAIGGQSIDLLIEGRELVALWDQYGYDPAWLTLGEDRLAEISSVMSQGRPSPVDP
jgi:hypothetical protein